MLLGAHFTNFTADSDVCKKISAEWQNLREISKDPHVSNIHELSRAAVAVDDPTHRMSGREV